MLLLILKYLIIIGLDHCCKKLLSISVIFRRRKRKAKHAHSNGARTFDRAEKPYLSFSPPGVLVVMNAY
jgi:hypothetical protein